MKLPSILALVLTLVSSASAEEPTAQKFLAGLILPMSGALEGYGDAIRNGFELAREDRPENFSKIEWRVEDSRYDPKVSVTALESLRNRERIQLYHTWGVSPNEALIPILEANKLPVIAETTLKLQTVNKHYVIRAARTGEMLADALVKELSKRKAHRVGMLVVQIPYYEDIVSAMQRVSEANGVKVEVLNSYLDSTSDFRSSILKAKREEFDAVGVFLLPAQIQSFYKQAQELQYKPQTFGSDIPDSQSLIASCADTVDGMFFTTIGVTTPFRDRYLKRFGSDEFIGSAAQGYDTAMMIGDLFNDGASSTLSSDEIIRRFKGLAPRHGVTGDFQFSESADDGMAFRMPVAMKMVVGKRITELH